MDDISKISNTVVKKPRKTKKKMLEDFKVISPTSPLRQQIKEALKPEIELLSNQRPKIIIMEDSSKVLKPKAKTKKVKAAKSPEKSPSPKTKKAKKTKKVEFVIEEEMEIIPVKKQRKTRKLLPSDVHILEGISQHDVMTVSAKAKEKEIEPEKSLKTPEVKQVIMQGQQPNKVYNQEFIDILEKLSAIMVKQGEPFRARAYQKAQETIMSYPNDITDPEQLKGQPGIGDTIMDKFNEYVQTGTLKVLEREKTNPLNILTDVYGIGPKKAKELVDKGITTIDQLRAKQDELNDIQRVGLQYYEQVLERIPRSEIEEYKSMFQSTFAKGVAQDPSAKFEIVGSYRRGAKNSGDIDVIITGNSGAVYKAFIDELIKQKIILNVLSRGASKTLVIAKLPGKQVARRVDFLYSPPDEFPFAILYFTGSKAFNTVMRNKALSQGYTLNEHGISTMENKVKGAKIEQPFEDEKAIFDFLKMAYKAPTERTDGRAVVALGDVGAMQPASQKMAPTSMKALPSAPLVDVGAPKPKAKKAAPTPMKAVPTINVGTVFASETAAAPTSMKASEEIPPEVQANIEKFAHEGITVLEHLNEKMLVDMIRFASKVYYNSKQIITDNQYDIIKEFTNTKFPSNAAVTEIGAEVERNKAQLPYEMASMDKIKPDTGALAEWSHKYKGPYVLSCKLDGVSGLYTTEGPVPKMYTRGNGTVGQDISYLIPHMQLPKTKGIAIRGEFIIPKAVFDAKYKTKFANPRNMVAGIINHKTLNETIKDIHFVAYETIIPAGLSPSKQLEFLDTVDVERVLYKTVTS